MNPNEGRLIPVDELLANPNPNPNPNSPPPPSPPPDQVDDFLALTYAKHEAKKGAHPYPAITLTLTMTLTMTLILP